MTHQTSKALGGGIQPSNAIFLVDDENSIRTLLKRMLENEGYFVVDADSIQAAMALWKISSASISLLVLDIVLSNSGSGRKLAEQFLLDKPGIPIIFISGYGEDLFSDLAARPGISFIQKPFDAGQFLEMVRSAMNKD